MTNQDLKSMNETLFSCLKARNFLFLLRATLKGVPCVAKLGGIVSSSALKEPAPARMRLEMSKEMSVKAVEVHLKQLITLLSSKALQQCTSRIGAM